MIKRTISSLTFAATFSVALLLSACGGGGSDSGSTASSNNGSGTTTASTVTSSNAQNVGGQNYGTAAALSSSINGNASLLAGGVSTAAPTPSLLDVVLQRAYAAVANAPGAGIATGVSSSSTTHCSGGGTETVSYNVADVNTITPGDTLTISTSNCTTSGFTSSGSVTIAFSNFSGTFSTTGAWSGSLTFHYSNFSVVIGSDSSELNGDMSISYNQTGYQASSYSASGTSLQFSTVIGGVSTSRTLSNYSYTGSRSGNTYTFAPNYTVSGAFGTLGNTGYTVKTLTAFQQIAGSFPYQGSLIVTASDNTSLTLTAVDSTSVKLDIDSDGDGVANETKTVTWTSLYASIN